MCVVADAPLPVDTRIGVVNLAVEHELLARQCEVSIPVVRPPRGIVERVKYLFGHRETQFQGIEDGPPGPWLADRVRSLDTDFHVHSRWPRWNGEDVTGPFIYQALRTPQPVKIGNAYRRADERSRPHRCALRLHPRRQEAHEGQGHLSRELVLTLS